MYTDPKPCFTPHTVVTYHISTYTTYFMLGAQYTRQLHSVYGSVMDRHHIDADPDRIPNKYFENYINIFWLFIRLKRIRIRILFRILHTVD